MNYDEFIELAKRYSGDNFVKDLLQLLQDWKRNDESAATLAINVDDFLRDMRSKLDEDIYRDLFEAWNEFKRIAIDGIGGMTVNERLYWFGLFDRFDRTIIKKDLIYSKLHAKR